MNIIAKTLIILFFCSSALFAQETSLQGKDQSAELNNFIGIPEELIEKTDDFFELIVKKQIKRAFNEFLDKSPISRKLAEKNRLIAQTKKAFKLYGRIKKFEPVNSESVTKSYIRLRYIGLHANFPMRWVFTFYNSPEKGWIVTNIKFDDLSEFFFSDE